VRCLVQDVLLRTLLDHVWYPMRGLVQHITNLEMNVNDVVTLSLGGGGRKFSEVFKGIYSDIPR